MFSLCYHFNMKKENVKKKESAINKRQIVMIFKVIACLLALGAMAGLCLYVHFKGDVKYNILTYVTFGIPFLLSLAFMCLNFKRIMLTCALAAVAVANFFIIVMPINNSSWIYLGILCGAQLFFLIYSLTLPKHIGLKVLNLATRALLCLLTYFILPKFFELPAYELVGLMCLVNSFVTLISLLIHIKSQWLAFIGLLIYFAGEAFIWLLSGGAAIFGWAGKFFEILLTYNIPYYCSIAGLAVIACASVWLPSKRR